MRVFTGSAETESEIRKFHADINGGLPRSMFDDYWFRVMTKGRNQPGDYYEGSQAFDDVGGFLEQRADCLVYLTEKGKGCIK